MVEKDGLTYPRAEGEGYEKPTSNFKNVGHLPNHGEHLFSISTEVKIRYNVFKGQKTPSVLEQVRESLQCITGKNM